MPKQLVCEPLAHKLRLIPPLADEFDVYGGDATVTRARKWALQHKYLLVDGVSKCAHGLYGLSMCPGDTCRSQHFQDFDHVNLWVPYPDPYGRVTDRPFILMHPYTKQVNESTRWYAKSHGLTLHHLDIDRWYSNDSVSTLPIRLVVAESWPVWPIEIETAALVATQPVDWGDSDSETSCVDDDMPKCYFIQSGQEGPIKIGFTSRSVQKRLLSLQTAHSESLRVLLVLPGNRELEKALHRQFQAYRKEGEWFVPSVELLSLIKERQWPPA